MRVGMLKGINFHSG